MAIKERIKERRTAAGLTLEDVAKGIHVGKATVQRWESGAISTIRDDKLLPLAEILRTSPEYLLGLINNPDSRDAFHCVILRDQWERENYPSEFDQKKFDVYQQPLLERADSIMNYIYSICLQVPVGQVSKPKGLDLQPSPQDPCYAQKMAILTEYLQKSQGIISAKRLDAVLEMIEQMEELLKLKIKLSDEISPAEF